MTRKTVSALFLFIEKKCEMYIDFFYAIYTLKRTTKNPINLCLKI